MAEIILHHYAISPFSEKIRKILGHKRASWCSVEQPAIMPKPKLTPLTGGYRRIPVMQLGADVYCDTEIIVRKLEELLPEPTIYPGGSQGLCHMISQWADRRLFFAIIPVVFQRMAGAVPKEFIEDRQKMMSGASFTELLQTAPDALNQLRGFLAMIDAQLDGRPFLLGDAFSLADAACFHSIWFCRNEADTFALVKSAANVMRWFERIDAMGHGDAKLMDPDRALAIARESSSSIRASKDLADPNRLEPGMRVSITPDDYGPEPVTGTVVASSAYEIAIEREEAGLGRIVVHFPKVGFRIKRA